MLNLLLRKVDFKLGTVTFQISLWDTRKRGEHGQYELQYVLTKITEKEREVIFNKDYFSVGFDPRGDLAVKEIMDWLTELPGDVEKSYFKNYTTEQIAFRDEFAEDLKYVVEEWYEKRNKEDSDV